MNARMHARREVGGGFRHILSGDEQCKAPAGDSSLPELSHDELSLLLSFLYTGTLDQNLPERHLHALLVAADKYDVPFLRRACEARLAAAVEPGNVHALCCGYVWTKCRWAYNKVSWGA